MFNSSTGRLRGLMATTLLATMPTALACESTPTTSDDTRTVEVRVENGETSVVVDGQAIPGDRIRRTDGGIMVLGEDGRPMPGIRIDTGMPAAAGGIVVEGANENVFVVKRKASAPGTGMVMAGPDGKVMVVDGAELQWTTDEPPRVMLGIRMTPTPKGVGVVDVIPGTPAAAAGLRTGDVIMSHEDAVLTPARLGEKLGGFQPGQTVAMRVLRDDEVITTQVRLVPWDPTAMDAAGGGTIIEMGHPLEGGEMPDDMRRIIRRMIGGDGDGEEMEILVEMLMSEHHVDHEDHDDHEHHEHHGHHDRHHGGHGDVERILDVLREHLPHLFHDAHVNIDVEGDGDREIELHIEIHREGDHGDHHGHGHHEGHDGRDHDRGHHDDHERHMHEAFEEIHHHVESMIGEVMEGMHEMHERVPMIERQMQRQLEEFAREWTREAEGFAREWQEETEGFARELEGVMNERAREGEAFARRVGEALRRSEERNRMLEERITRLESMLERMGRRQAPQADRPAPPDRPRRRGDRDAAANDA